MPKYFTAVSKKTKEVIAPVREFVAGQRSKFAQEMHKKYMWQVLTNNKEHNALD